MFRTSNVLQQQSLPQFGLQLGGICGITACHLADTSVIAIYHYYIEAAGCLLPYLTVGIMQG